MHHQISRSQILALTFGPSSQVATSNMTVMIRRPAKAPGRISGEEPGCINIHMLRSRCSLLPFSFLQIPPDYLFPPCTGYSLFYLYSPSQQQHHLRGKTLEKVRPNTHLNRLVALKLPLQRSSSNSSSGTGIRLPTSAKISSVQLVSALT